MSDHLNTLESRLLRERARLANAKTPKERGMCRVWVAQIEKELADELAFAAPDAVAMSADDLYAELTS